MLYYFHRIAFANKSSEVIPSHGMHPVDIFLETKLLDYKLESSKRSPDQSSDILIIDIEDFDWYLSLLEKLIYLMVTHPNIIFC